MFKPYVFEDKKQFGSNYKQNAQSSKNNTTRCLFCLAIMAEITFDLRLGDMV